MITRNLFFSILLSIMVPFSANAEDYNIDNYQGGAHSTIQFKASHFGFSYVIGRFNQLAGQFSYIEETPESSSISVEIKANSVDTSHAERDKHLRGKKFFNVKKYPTISFESTDFKEHGDGSITVAGNLTLHGVTKSIAIKGRHLRHGDDPWGGYRRGVEGSVNLDVTEFGFPGWVGNVEVYVVIEGVRI